MSAEMVFYLSQFKNRVQAPTASTNHTRHHKNTPDSLNGYPG